ncbi:MAG TPA: hypothetical protein VKT73_04525 [Xanthobacteraceae bacterium]|nr:hypothetical protein [Xanthobacteraceae bacterium]
MTIKPNIQVLPPEVTRMPPGTRSLPAQVSSMPSTLATPATTWGAKRQTNYVQQLTALTSAQAAYLRARADLAKAFVENVRAINEVYELPEILHNDTEIRRLGRERGYLNAKREVAEAKYGLCATLNEVDKVQRPRLKKALRHDAAVNALMNVKVDKEALGEDTSQLDHALSELQRE